MEGDDHFFEASQQSQDNDEGSSKKKKKKSKKSRRNLDEEFSNAQDMYADEDMEESQLSQSQNNISTDFEVEPEPGASASKKKKKKKKASRSQDDDYEEEEEQHEMVNERDTFPVHSAVSSATSRFSPKKEPVTPIKKAPAATTNKIISGVSSASSEPDPRDAINLVSAMSHDDIELLLNKVGAECPINDTKNAKKRETEIDWSKVAFSCYGPKQCKMVWNFLQTQTRKFRIMHEVVEEVKYNLKIDYSKFIRKNIEAAPDFPRQPYASGGFQYYCKEKWDAHKNLQEKMNKKVENFLHFQTACHKRWESLSSEQHQHYVEQAKLMNAEYKQKIREFYSRYPTITRVEEKLNKDGKPEAKDKPMSDHYRKQALKMSRDIYHDAPKFPSTPMQLYLISKLNEVEPPPTSKELPELKTGLCNKWKGLSSKKKLKWIKKCIRSYERYQLEVGEYKKTHPMFFLPREFQISKLVNKDEFNIWADSHGRPPKPKNTIYESFLEEFRSSEEAEGRDEEEILQVAELKWKGLSKMEKDRHGLNFKLQHLNFRKEIEEYISTVPDLLRTNVIDTLPKKYQKHFLEVVEKKPLVKEEDLLVVEDEDGGSLEIRGTSKRKITNNNEDDSNSGESSSVQHKRTRQDVEDTSLLPLYADDLGDEHKKLVDQSMNEQRQRKIAATALEQDGRRAKDFYPGKKISPQILNEAIRGIFDGRQFERRFTVYYYYAKYVAREKSWLVLYRTIGIVETAARIIETFNRLSKQEKQTFLDEAFRFHNTIRYYDKHLTNKDGRSSRVRYFSEEPKPPPRRAMQLYQREVQWKKAQDPNYEAPSWEQLDDQVQMRYLKKLYKLKREYILEYEKFVRNMTPNDMIEYVIQQARNWNDVKEKGRGEEYGDHQLYSAAVAARSSFARETYSQEMSDDGQESEPELYSREDGSQIVDLGTKKFHYRANPFITRKSTKNKTLVDKLLSIDSEDSNSDDDETGYGYLVRGNLEKKEEHKFRRKLKETERYNYPLEEYYETLDVLKLSKKVQKIYESKWKANERRQQLSLTGVTDYQRRWNQIRTLVNCDIENTQSSCTRTPKITKKKKALGAARTVTKKTNKSGRKILRRKTKSPKKKGAYNENESMIMMKVAMNLMQNKMSAPQPQQNDLSEISDDENGEGNVPHFVRTAERVPAETREISPERESASGGIIEVDPRSQPGLMLVSAQPASPPGKKSNKSQNKYKVESEGSRHFLDDSPFSPPTSPILAATIFRPFSSLAPPMEMVPSLQQFVESSDEFQLLDTLADFEGGGAGATGVFSEFELNQLNDST